MERVTKVKHERVGVFVTFVTKNPEKIWRNNPDLTGKPVQDANVYEFTIFMRHDCRLGFIGGSKEQNEILKEAVIRETNEELPSVTEIVKEKIENNDYERLVHTNGRMNFVLFVVKVTNDEFKKIVEMMKTQFHDDTYREITGICTIPVYKLKYLSDKVRQKKDRGLYVLLNHPMATSVKEEVICILKELLPETDFKEIVEYAKIPEEAYKISRR